MAKKKKSKNGMISTNQTVADNRAARFNYELHDTFEAGLMLRGTEVKSLRIGQCSIKESYVGPKNGDLWLFNANISEYQQAGSHLQHDPKRPRQLLMHKREIHRLMGAVAKEGMSIVATKLYFDSHGRAKLEISLGKGKKLHDKRETDKKRDWSRQKQRLLKTQN